ncbi:STAS domain-containing protein [Streptomyces rochei]|uniref:Anti-sigma factor antagonist n=1 Tax=Streptomyces rochei TaxID=1928 RepID=A0ABW7DXV8_STRRO
MRGSERPEQPDRLSITTTVTDSVRVVTVAGEIDQSNSAQLTLTLRVGGPDVPRVVIDLGRVTFMDSSGINVLIAAHKDLTAAGGWLRLAAPTTAVLRVLQLVGVDQLIECHPTLTQALPH